MVNQCNLWSNQYNRWFNQSNQWSYQSHQWSNCNCNCIQMHCVTQLFSGRNPHFHCFLKQDLCWCRARCRLLDIEPNRETWENLVVVYFRESGLWKWFLWEAQMRYKKGKLVMIVTCRRLVEVENLSGICEGWDSIGNSWMSRLVRDLWDLMETHEAQDSSELTKDSCSRSGTNQKIVWAHRNSSKTRARSS